MEDPEVTLDTALLFTLDDLSKDNFRRFKNKLRYFSLEGRDPIPWGELKDADTMELMSLLLGAYGWQDAPKVTVQVLRAINMHDSASRFQEWAYNERKKKYKMHTQEAFQNIPQLGSYSSRLMTLQQDYIELLLRRTKSPQEGAHELVALDRKHREMKTFPNRGPKVELKNIFDSDAEGESSRTVVLFGPAGIGKTTATWKVLLNWASGKLWQDKFDYVFYISCRAANGRRLMSAIEMILNTCPPGMILAEDVLARQENILLIVDNFDELNHSNEPCGPLSNDPHKKQDVVGLVMGLLRGKVLPRCHLLVATRPMGTGQLLRYSRSPLFVEVLGFHPIQRKEYFHQFFQGKEEAIWIFELVQRNEIPFNMCFLPATCWVICSIFQQRPKPELLQDIPETATVTEIYMRLLLSFLGSHSRLKDLEELCSLAIDGVLHKTMAFSEEELKERGFHCLGLESLSERWKVFHPDASLATWYRFSHLSFQEFFAALFYLLDHDENAAIPSRDLSEVFRNQKECSSNYLMLIRFLFGLSNTKRMSVLQESWSCRLSRIRLWQVLLCWTDQEAKSWVDHKAKSRFFRQEEHLLELCHCIYETKDSTFAQSVMKHIHNLDLKSQLSTELDFAAFSFCLSASEHFNLLQLFGCELGPARFRQLSAGFLKSSEIQLNHCGLNPTMCKDLTAITVSNIKLTSLDLSENPLKDLGVTHLCEWLLHPTCQLQRLRLHHCSLTAAACQPLSLVLESNRPLVELSLGENPLGDEGIRQVCQGLQHPSCRLQRLALHCCGLTAGACGDLSSVLETSETLAELNLGDNGLGDEGIRQLCLGLRKQQCTLQKLTLTVGSLNRNTRQKLQAACSRHPCMTLIPYYPPDLPPFPGAGE